MKQSLTALVLCAILGAQAAPSSEPAMPANTTHAATGTFDVKLDTEPLSAAGGRAGIGRMSIEKRFAGDLDATSAGEMLAFRSQAAGSAGYVAMETVVGRLQGRQGTFVLQHSSTMDRGAPRQSVTVVPGSGTGELAGLSGSMTIQIEGGRHGYRFEYRFE